MYKTRNLPNTRVEVADALRGIAVIGIILFHSVEHFNIFPTEPAVHTLACDKLVSDVLAWLLSGKMYGIFAMLFGLSFFIMNDNQQQMGRSFSGRFAWRMFLLLCFGMVNMALYDGDILMVYAFVGLILIPISYLPSKAVWVIIALLAIQPVEIYRLLSGWDMDTDKLWGLADYMGDVGAAVPNDVSELVGMPEGGFSSGDIGVGLFFKMIVGAIKEIRKPREEAMAYPIAEVRSIVANSPKK